MAGRRARRFVRASIASLVAVGALLGIGVAVPEFMIDDGLGDLDAREQRIARDALEVADNGCLDNPFQRRTVRAIRVASVQKDGRSNRSPRSSTRGGYQVRLQTYTLFGIRRQTITVQNGEVDCGVS